MSDKAKPDIFTKMFAAAAGAGTAAILAPAVGKVCAAVAGAAVAHAIDEHPEILDKIGRPAMSMPMYPSPGS